MFDEVTWRRLQEAQGNGTNRVAAIRCDLDSPEDYVARAEALAEANGRKIVTKSLIQSFENVEMDLANPLDVETVSDLGYEFAKRLHPNSDVLVVTHVDGEGGHPHNHIKIMNHDDVTEKAIRGNDMYFQFWKVNDDPMREHGLSVAEWGSRGKSKDQAQYWEHRRDATGVTEFDRWLGDAVHESLFDRRPTDQAQFEQFLADNKIELVESEHVIKESADGTSPKHVSVGWTYRAMDEFGPKRRTRRRAASSLSEKFAKVRAEKTSSATASSPWRRSRDPTAGSCRTGARGDPQSRRTGSWARQRGTPTSWRWDAPATPRMRSTSRWPPGRSSRPRRRSPRPRSPMLVRRRTRPDRRSRRRVRSPGLPGRRRRRRLRPASLSPSRRSRAPPVVVVSARVWTTRWTG